MLFSTAKLYLVNNGFDAVFSDYLKNGHMVHAISVKFPDGSIGVNLTEKHLERFDDDDEREFIDWVTEQINLAPYTDVADWLDRDYILSHVRMCVQGISDEDIPKHICKGDLEEYYRVILDEGQGGYGSIKVTHEMLKSYGLTLDKVRAYAVNNLVEHVTIKSMFDTLIEMMGADKADLLGMDCTEAEQMFVATTDDKMYGAGVINLEGVLDRFAEDHGVDTLILIPSSIHEILIIIPNLDKHEDDINQMINEVNATQVDKFDVLSNHVYYYYR